MDVVAIFLVLNKIVYHLATVITCDSQECYLFVVMYVLTYLGGKRRGEKEEKEKRTSIYKSTIY